VPGSTLIGDPARPPAADAALANGTLCHGLDFDDTHPASICHVSTVVAPAALATAEQVGADGRELLAALVVGSEVVASVGALAAPSYMERGFHPTSVCGVFGAAAAAARLRGLDTAATANALGIAGSTAAGLFEYLGDGSSTKQLHAGWAAHAGIHAAALAGHGATGPDTVFEGRFGLLRAYFDREVDAAEVPLPPEAGWQTPHIAFKPYPACHFVHSCLDAVAALGVSADEVESAEVLVPPPAVPLVLEPREAKVAPRTPYDAKFSLQYSLAAQLVHGEVGVATYSPAAIRDERVLELAERVTYEERAFDTYPASFPGGVRLALRDGRVLESILPHQRGGPGNPMSEADVLDKFRANARLGLPEADVHSLETALLELERCNDVPAALAPLARVSAAVPVV
jgi:2-methylcitrate dehydratase PrpD